MDTRIVDHDVEAAERINSGVHNRLSAEFVGHRRITRYGFAAGVLDLPDDVFGGRRRRTGAVDADAVVGDDDTRALGGQQQRVTSGRCRDRRPVMTTTRPSKRNARFRSSAARCVEKNRH